MGRTRGKLKGGKSGKKFVKDRVLRGKIVCNSSSGLMHYGSDGKEVCSELIGAILP
jgi:hypothetical protein